MALTKKKITVRGKNGKTFQRSVMVRAGEAVKRTAGKVAKFVGKHKGKIAGAAALAGAAYLGVRHRGAIAGIAHGLKAAHAERARLHAGAKETGVAVRPEHVRNAAGKKLDAHFELGRARDDIRAGKRSDAARGAASSLVTRAVSGVAGLHAAVSSRLRRKPKAS